jgi:hypothetical protein
LFERAQSLDSDRRQNMLKGEELLLGIEQYGRWNMQEFVARSQDMTDVLTYLRAERVLAIVKAISFVTVDTVSFERRTSLPSLSDETGRESQNWMQPIQKPWSP